jgi:hypothetical protein
MGWPASGLRSLFTHLQVLDPLDCLVACIVDDACIEVPELTAAALLVSLEVLATWTAELVFSRLLAGAKGNIGALA